LRRALQGKQPSQRSESIDTHRWRGIAGLMIFFIIPASGETADHLHLFLIQCATKTLA
jgi:hypothetical protein